jgi:hypothetical protein
MAKKKGEVRAAVAYVLLGLAVAVLGIGFIWAILDTVAVADWEMNPGSQVAATFFEDIIWTLMVAGILYGFYCLAAFAKEKSDLLDGEDTGDTSGSSQ